jgi:hypothetical protein
MNSCVSAWDTDYKTMPADQNKQVRISYADLYGLVLLKRIIDPTFDADCMSFVTMTSVINPNTPPYDLDQGKLPVHGKWRVLSSATRLKTAEELIRYREICDE